MDGQVARREERELGDLLDQFVCVRVVQMWGVDLDLFQFDGHLTWAVFFMNADRAIYGRYGSRSSPDAAQDVSIEGFKKAMEGALELHKAYPADRRALAGKTGATRAWKTAEALPAWAGRFKAGDTSRRGCVHCHFVDDGWVKSAWMTRHAVPDTLLWSYPMPDALGLSLDPRERATVKGVAAGSAAEKAGFRIGDRIRSLDGQPLLSIADVQWALHVAQEPGTLDADVERGGQAVAVRLPLAPGWRRARAFAWRDTTYAIRPGIFCEPVPPDERKRLSLAEGAPALRVKECHVEWGALLGKKIDARAAGLAKGDVITGVDGQGVPPTESDFIAYVWQRKKPGESVELTVLRGGTPQTVRLPLP